METTVSGLTVKQCELLQGIVLSMEMFGFLKRKSVIEFPAEFIVGLEKGRRLFFIFSLYKIPFLCTHLKKIENMYGADNTENYYDNVKLLLTQEKERERKQEKGVVQQHQASLQMIRKRSDL